MIRERCGCGATIEFHPTGGTKGQERTDQILDDWRNNHVHPQFEPTNYDFMAAPVEEQAGHLLNLLRAAGGSEEWMERHQEGNNNV